MYVLYLDESGDPHSSWEAQSNFVIGGIAVFEGEVSRFARQLDEIQSRFFPSISIRLPFHASKIYSGKERFGTLAPATRTDLLSNLYRVIEDALFPDLIVFATATHVSRVRDSEQVLELTFEDVCQRFNTFLVRQHKLGRPTKGLLVIDQAHQKHYRNLLSRFQQHTRYGFIGNVIDIPYFAGIADTRLLQLADLCAYAVFRRYEYDDDTYLRKILPRVDRRLPRGGPDGLKHFTRTRDCICEACCWRRPSGHARGRRGL